MPPGDPVPVEPVVVPARCNGPDRSANGGWVCGLLGARVDHPVGGVGAMVTLRSPPPLDRPLAVRPDAVDAVRLVDGDVLVAEAVRAPVGVAAVPRVPAAEAATCEPAYGGLVASPFPRCVVCGVARDDGFGMRPGPLGPVDAGRTACRWTPGAWLAGDDGRAAPHAVWAALDCPGAWTTAFAERPMLLGRMAARVDTLPDVGEPCVVVGLRLGGEGRKTWTATTAYGADGRELGRAHATWIAVL